MSSYITSQWTTSIGGERGCFNVSLRRFNDSLARGRGKNPVFPAAFAPTEADDSLVFTRDGSLWLASHGDQLQIASSSTDDVSLVFTRDGSL